MFSEIGREGLCFLGIASDVNDYILSFIVVQEHFLFVGAIEYITHMKYPYLLYLVFCGLNDFCESI